MKERAGTMVSRHSSALVIAAIVLAALASGPARARAEVPAVVESAAAAPGKADAASCVGEADATTPRCRLRAHFFVGLSLDNFTSSELQGVLNPDEASDIRERGVAGFLVDYRITPQRAGSRDSLWISAETTHGVRSTDVDCKANPGISVCRDNLQALPEDPAAEAIFVLRSATSLEGGLGIRWERRLAPARDGEPGGGDLEHPDVALYLKAKAGFITVSGAGGDLIDNHHVGFGGIATEGRYRGSYIEIGHGTTDLYAVRSDDRWKVDGVLRWSLNKGKSSFWPFARMTVDTDAGPGSDSVQTYLGVELDLGNLLSLGK